MNSLQRMGVLISVFTTISLYAQASPAEPMGWLWYKDPITSSQKEGTFTQNVRSPLDAVHQIKKEFEHATAQALIFPTFENVRSLQRLQTQILNRSERFSRMWQWVALQDASHWQAASHPNPVHRDIRDAEERQKLTHHLKRLARSFGLFLFFKSNCPYCHAFAPIVKKFAETYGFVVKVISVDGGTLEGFSQVEMDNGAIEKINPYGIFPSLFLINPTTHEVMALSWGLNALSVLENQARLIGEHNRAEHGLDRNTSPTP